MTGKLREAEQHNVAVLKPDAVVENCGAAAPLLSTQHSALSTSLRTIDWIGDIDGFVRLIEPVTGVWGGK